MFEFLNSNILADLFQFDGPFQVTICRRDRLFNPRRINEAVDRAFFRWRLIWADTSAECPHFACSLFGFFNFGPSKVGESRPVSLVMIFCVPFWPNPHISVEEIRCDSRHYVRICVLCHVFQLVPPWPTEERITWNIQWHIGIGIGIDMNQSISALGDHAIVSRFYPIWKNFLVFFHQVNRYFFGRPNGDTWVPGLVGVWTLCRAPSWGRLSRPVVGMFLLESKSRADWLAGSQEGRIGEHDPAEDEEQEEGADGPSSEPTDLEVEVAQHDHRWGWCGVGWGGLRIRGRETETRGHES